MQREPAAPRSNRGRGAGPGESVLQGFEIPEHVAGEDALLEVCEPRTQSLDLPPTPAVVPITVLALAARETVYDPILFNHSRLEVLQAGPKLLDGLLIELRYYLLRTIVS
jgi:hypothetical protein